MITCDTVAFKSLAFIDTNFIVPTCLSIRSPLIKIIYIYFKINIKSIVHYHLHLKFLRITFQTLVLVANWLASRIVSIIFKLLALWAHAFKTFALKLYISNFFSVILKSGQFLAALLIANAGGRIRFLNRYRLKRPKVDASIFAYNANSLSTFGRFRLWTSFESSPVSVKMKSRITTNNTHLLLLKNNTQNKFYSLRS